MEKKVAVNDLMLKLGVFGGKYMTDCEKEFPKELVCRQKQRQAVLHWAYDSKKI